MRFLVTRTMCTGRSSVNWRRARKGRTCWVGCGSGTSPTSMAGANTRDTRTTGSGTRARCCGWRRWWTGLTGLTGMTDKSSLPAAGLAASISSPRVPGGDRPEPGSDGEHLIDPAAGPYAGDSWRRGRRRASSRAHLANLIGVRGEVDQQGCGVGPGISGGTSTSYVSRSAAHREATPVSEPATTPEHQPVGAAIVTSQLGAQ